MASSAGDTSIGGTLTGGIQDISALLPLLGTEQCEIHVSSALTNGYLYVAATPMSIFGSLGIVRAGFKGLVAGISLPRWNFVGAQKLQDAGFEPKGTNLSLIMLDPDDSNRHLAESRLTSLLDDLHIENVDNLKATTNCFVWNVKALCLTALLCAVSVVPYVHLNIRGDSRLSPFVRWAFPIVRACGGFLTATMLQIVIQRRVSALMKKHLLSISVDRNIDALKIDASRDRRWDTHKALEPRLWQLEQYIDAELRKETEVEKSQQADRQSLHDLKGKLVSTRRDSGLLWPFLALLLIGNIASVIGYVGCFSVVQSSRRGSGPLIWLCLEVALTMIRIFLWAWNARSDEPTPITLTFALASDPPLPTCNKFVDEIEDEKVLPLVRARKFLEDITSYAGLVKRFDDPSVSLFYTLTRHAPSDNHRLPPERALYITLFDATERTTRVFSQDSNGQHLRSADPLVLDMKYGVLETRIREKIEAWDDDPVATDNPFMGKLREHYMSILDHLHENGGRSIEEIINPWTLKGDDTTSDPESKATENICEDDVPYLTQGRLEQRERSLCEKRGHWIEKYMAQVRRDADHDFERVGHGSEEDKRETEEIEILLAEEWIAMECMFIGETRAWEYELAEGNRAMVGKVLKRRRASSSLKELGDLKKQLVNDWRKNKRMRLTKAWDSMHKRLGREKDLRLGAVLKRGADEQRVKSRWEELLEMVNKEWVQLLKETDEVWRELLQNVDKEWDSLTPESTGTEYPSSESRQVGLSSHLKDFAGAMDWRIRYLGQRIVDISEQEPQPTGDATDSKQLSTLQSRCTARRNEMEGRLYDELKDVEARIEDGLEHSANEFQSTEFIARLTVQKHRWVAISPTMIQQYGVAEISRVLGRNRAIFYLQFEDWYDDLELAKAIPITHKMLSLTTIKFRFALSAGHPSLSAPLLKALEENPHIVSIDGCSADLRDALQSNADRPSNRTSVSFESGLLINNGFHAIQNFQCYIRFLGPSKGILILRILHSATPTGVRLIIRVEGKNHIELPVPTAKTSQNVILSSNNHWAPGVRNVVSLSLAGPFGAYYLDDIELLDEMGFPYNPDGESNPSA